MFRRVPHDDSMRTRPSGVRRPGVLTRAWRDDAARGPRRCRKPAWSYGITRDAMTQPAGGANRRRADRSGDDRSKRGAPAFANARSLEHRFVPADLMPALARRAAFR